MRKLCLLTRSQNDVWGKLRKNNYLKKCFFLVVSYVIKLHKWTQSTNTSVILFSFFCVFVDLFFFSGRCGIQSELIVRNGTTERAGIKESTAAPINGGKGPPAVDRKASTIKQILFQKGIRL